MSQKSSNVPVCRLRIDPALVETFRRLHGGINEIGTRIVRDIGLRYEYDKSTGNLDILGPDADILALAVETLRFWVEEDDFPTTGVTCQVGYPNRGLVIWRFHGDYAKKFDHLFTEDIARLKLTTSVNIKAIPNKRNPEYVELFCHFSVYQKIKDEIKRITGELGNVFQDDFFIPSSDRKKAKKFAVNIRKNNTVLFALKDYPDKVRILMFGRNQADVMRARKEWVNQLRILSKDTESMESSKGPGSELISASVVGDNASSVFSEQVDPAKNHDTSITKAKQLVRSNSNIMSTLIQNKVSKASSFNKELSPRGPKKDNSNFPRPLDFVYPVQKEGLSSIPPNDPEQASHEQQVEDVFVRSILESDGFTKNLVKRDATGKYEWVADDGTASMKSKRSTMVSNRIYVHHQVTVPSEQVPIQHIDKDKKESGVKQRQGKSQVNNRNVRQVVNASTNMKGRGKTNTRNNNLKTKSTQSYNQTRNQPVKKGSVATRNSLKPVPKAQRRPRTNKAPPPQPAFKYNINVSGLNISLYKDSIAKVNSMDALVNVVMSDLKTGDKVAKEMLNEVGKQVIDEINVNLSINGEVETADNIVTSAGKLPALGIIHVVSPVWKCYTVWEECASDLHKAIYNTLKTAESHKYRKIAMPTIGSGLFLLL